MKKRDRTDRSVPGPAIPDAIPAREEKKDQGGSSPCFLTEEEGIDPDYLGLPVTPARKPDGGAGGTRGAGGKQTPDK